LKITKLVIPSSNATTNNTVNNTTNITNNTTNTTNATTQISSATNGTTNATTNNTVNNTNASTNTTTPANVTNTTNLTQPSNFTAIIITDKDVYDFGETIKIGVLPVNSTYSLYMNAPSGNYFLTGLTWDTIDVGSHTISGLVTYNGQTERASKTVTVNSAAGPLTASFTESCVETCSILESGIFLEIIVDGIVLELDHITYVPREQNETNVTNTSNTAR